MKTYQIIKQNKLTVEKKKIKKFGNFKILITRKSNEKKNYGCNFRNKILYLKQKNLNPKTLKDYI